MQEEKIEIEELKKLFNKKKRYTRLCHEVGMDFDRAINKVWGFSFSDTDDDRMIDTLDYGTDSITFESFKKRMDDYKEQYDKYGEIKYPIP